MIPKLLFLLVPTILFPTGTLSGRQDPGNPDDSLKLLNEASDDESEVQGDSSGFIQGENDLLEFHARNLSVAEAFAQLRQLVQKNIVVAPDVSQTFTGDLYDLTPDETIQAICRSTGLIARAQGSFIYIEHARAEARVFRLDYARAEDVLILVQPLLSAAGSVSATIAADQGILPTQEEAGGDDYAAGDVLVIYDYLENLDRIDEVVALIDVFPLQVLIEATILSAELNDNLEYGVEFSALFGVDFQQAGVTSNDGLGLNFDEISGSDLDDGFGTTQSRLPFGDDSAGLNIGFTHSGVGVFVRALKSVTNTQILANPRVITLNKQRGEVLLGRRDGYITTTVSETSTTQTVEFLETGTRLIFRPFISSDGYVRLEIHPEDSEGGLNESGLPFKETSEVTTNVMVKDGQTLVIGGLFRNRARSTETKVPLLGDIPALGELFSSTENRVLREEIIILLTPRIIYQDSDDYSSSSTSKEQTDWMIPRRTSISNSYLTAARKLVAAGQFQTAEALLNFMDTTLPNGEQVHALQRQCATNSLEGPVSMEVDRSILEKMRTQLEEAEGGSSR